VDVPGKKLSGFFCCTFRNTFVQRVKTRSKVFLNIRSNDPFGNWGASRPWTFLKPIATLPEVG